MLASAPLVAMVATTNASRALPFYEETLGLRLIVDDQFALVFEAPGAALRVTKVERFTPQPFAVLAWGVADIGAAVAELTARGVVFERYEGMQQDEQGIWAPPGGDGVAWFKDPDGNLLSITQGHQR